LPDDYPRFEENGYGDPLFINQDESAVPGSQCFRTYTIEPNDTLYQIAKEFNVPLQDLISVNPQIADPNLIYPGQEICLPPLDTPREIIHRIQPGDTLYKIALQYNIDLNILIAVNPQLDPNRLFPGEILYVPVPKELRKGQATRYYPGDGGYCALPSRRRQGYYVAAMNRRDYHKNNCLLCGGYVEIFGPRGTVKVLIIDRSDDPAGNIDLQPEAYRIITGTGGGREPITWRIAPLDFKDGNKIGYFLHPQYNLVQVVNHLYPICKLAVWEGGTRVELKRLVQGGDVRNFFVGHVNLASKTFNFELIDYYGQKVDDREIRLSKGKTVYGQSQFKLLHSVTK
jgi:LysM repeat protein